MQPAVDSVKRSQLGSEWSPTWDHRKQRHLQRRLKHSGETPSGKVGVDN